MMSVIATILCLTSPQEDGRLRQAWPKLSEAWQALESCRGERSEGLSDELLRAIGKAYVAFEAAGCFDPEAPFEAAALKRFIQVRHLKGVGKVAAPCDDLDIGGCQAAQRCACTEGFEPPASEALLARLQESCRIHRGDAIIVREVSIVRTALKEMGLTADDTPPWLCRRLAVLVRALVLGEPYPTYPQPAAATPEQDRTIRGWIDDLAVADIEVREKATRALLTAGEVARPYLLEALKCGDPEIVLRAKHALGFGHAPWKKD